MKSLTVPRDKWRNGLLCLMLYATLWLALSGNQGWLFGIGSIGAATFLSLRLDLGLNTFRPRQLPGFLGFYLKELLVAGWQVAASACHPRLRISPHWVSFNLKSRSPATHMMLASFMCLLPGTLASRIQDEKMHIHLLDYKQPWRPMVEELESRLMHLLGETDP